jgi:hypothetical protein
MGEWADDTFWQEVDESMEQQEEIQAKIEAYEKIDEDVKNGIKPF